MLEDLFVLLKPRVTHLQNQFVCFRVFNYVPYQLDSLGVLLIVNAHYIYFHVFMLELSNSPGQELLFKLLEMRIPLNLVLNTLCVHIVPEIGHNAGDKDPVQVLLAVSKH